MKKFFFLILIVPVCFPLTYAQKFAYPVSDIPDSLYENAKAIVRDHKTAIEFEALDCIKVHDIRAITILDKSGDEHARGYFDYDKLKVIDNLTATIYNKLGDRIKSYVQKDFKDVSYDPYGSLYNDTRLLYLAGSSSTYPYTIVYDITYTKKYSYNIPNWYLINNYDVSLQNGSLMVITPLDYKLNYKEQNIPNKVDISSEKNKKIYNWQVSDIPAINYEPYSPSRDLFFPRIKLGPSEFAFNNYQGNTEDWKEYGKFFFSLNSGRDNISEETKEHVLEIKNMYDNDLDKVKALYRYVQDKTRYVSIQVGIGGIQPFSAKVVDENGYGDCKALTNYTNAILKAAGIPSYYALINSGSGQYSFDTAFVDASFDHVILNVPLEEKEIWLECTSQIMPFGFLGDFTDDRLALVITEEGGVLKRTTKYDIKHNKTIRKAEVYIDADGNGRANVNTTYSGLKYDDILGLIHQDYEKQKDYLYEKHIDIPDFRINSFSFSDYPDRFPKAVEHLDLELINYASASGSRIFIPLNLMNRFDDVPRKERDRKNPISIYQEFSTSDTIVFYLPEGYSIEHKPEGGTVEYDFGKLEYSVHTGDQEVIYIRHFELYRKTYTKEKYDDFVNFCRDMKKADKVKLILVKL